jgi:hypothetical protein
MQLSSNGGRNESMKNTHRALARLILTGLLAIAAGTAHAGTIDLTIVNSGVRAVDGLYLAAAAQSAWGPDLLDGDFLDQSQTVTVRGVSCNAASMVIVAEDVGGCFSYQSVACTGNAIWTITNSTPRDCGR